MRDFVDVHEQCSEHLTSSGWWSSALVQVDEVALVLEDEAGGPTRVCSTNLSLHKTHNGSSLVTPEKAH